MQIHFGKLILKYRKQHFIKAEQLAAMLGVTTDAIYKMEKKPDTKIDHVLKLSQQLKHDFFSHYQVFLSPNIYLLHEMLQSENTALQKEMEALRLENQLLKNFFKLTDSGKTPNP